MPWAVGPTLFDQLQDAFETIRASGIICNFYHHRHGHTFFSEAFGAEYIFIHSGQLVDVNDQVVYVCHAFSNKKRGFETVALLNRFVETEWSGDAGECIQVRRRVTGAQRWDSLRRYFKARAISWYWLECATTSAHASPDITGFLDILHCLNEICI